MLNGIQKKAFGKIPNISNKFYPTKTPVTAVMMIKIGCFTAKTRKHNRKPFFRNKFSSKKAIFVLLADHGQKWMG